MYYDTNAWERINNHFIAVLYRFSVIYINIKSVLNSRLHYRNSPSMQCNHPACSVITLLHSVKSPACNVVLREIYGNLSVVHCHLLVGIFSCQPSDLLVVSWLLSVDGCELILASLLIVLCEWILVTINCKLILKSWYLCELMRLQDVGVWSKFLGERGGGWGGG